MAKSAPSAPNLELVLITLALGAVALPALQQLQTRPTPEQLADIYERFKADVRRRLRKQSEPDGLESLFLAFATFSSWYGNLGREQLIIQIDKESNVSNINVNNSGNMTGVAIGDGAQVTADKIIANIRQQLPTSASQTDELKAILKAALEQLGKEKLDDEDRKEAEETVGKIEKEMTKPEPNKDRVSRWVETVEKVSKTVGNVIRSAAAIGALFT